MSMPEADRFTKRVADADWDTVTAEVNDYGCALLPQLLTAAECERVAALWDEPEHFRATINLRRHRFGDNGDYHYFARHSRNRWRGCGRPCTHACCRSPGTGTAKLGRVAEWLDTLDEWLDICHRPGQARPTPILLRYETVARAASAIGFDRDRLVPRRPVPRRRRRHRPGQGAAGRACARRRRLARADRVVAATGTRLRGAGPGRVGGDRTGFRLVQMERRLVHSTNWTRHARLAPPPSPPRT